jgi:hypothetical protein
MKLLTILFLGLALNSVMAKELTCKDLNKTCAICPDKKKRDAKTKKKILTLSDFACASGQEKENTKSYLDATTCLPLSDFCTVCADGKFRFIKSDNKYKALEEISSDLYECATSPRTIQGH